jgi:hypothetical protein
MTSKLRKLKFPQRADKYVFNFVQVLPQLDFICESLISQILFWWVFYF